MNELMVKTMLKGFGIDLDQLQDKACEAARLTFSIDARIAELEKAHGIYMPTVCISPEMDNPMAKIDEIVDYLKSLDSRLSSVVIRNANA